jgi:hypothetical protein
MWQLGDINADLQRPKRARSIQSASRKKMKLKKEIRIGARDEAFRSIVISTHLY